MILDVASWNVNGIRACAKNGFYSWLEGSKADVVLLQEVRGQNVVVRLAGPLRISNGRQID